MSLLRKGILVSGAQVASIGCTMVVGIIFRRTLGPDGMGQYDLFRTTATLAGTAAALGLGNANIYFLNNRKIELTRLTSNVSKAGVALGAVLAIALAATVLTAKTYFGEVSLPTILVFALGSAVSVNVNILRPILVAQLAAKRMISVDLSRPAFLLSAAVLLAAIGHISPETAIVSFSLAASCAYLVLLRFLFRNIDLRRPLEWRLLGDITLYGVKLSAANILYLLTGTITVLLLRYLHKHTFSQVGLYSSAVAICQLATLVPTALGPLLYAKWSGIAGDERRQQAEMAARMNLAYGMVAAVLLWIFGRFALGILYGEQFLAAYGALQILAPAMMLIPLFGVCNNLLAGAGHVSVTLMILVGTLVVVLGVGVATIPALGIQGAALSVFCGNTFTALAALFACRWLYGVRMRRCLLLTPTDVRYAWRSVWKRSAR